MPLDTIDIEELVTQFKDDFVSIFTSTVMSALIAEAPFLANPSMYELAERFIRWVITTIATQGGLVAFVFNTRVFTTDQGSDYIKMVQRSKKLPKDVSDDEWSRVERERLRAADNLIAFKR